MVVPCTNCRCRSHCTANRAWNCVGYRDCYNNFDETLHDLSKLPEFIGQHVEEFGGQWEWGWGRQAASLTFHFFVYFGSENEIEIAMLFIFTTNFQLMTHSRFCWKLSRKKAYSGAVTSCDSGFGNSA